VNGKIYANIFLKSEVKVIGLDGSVEMTYDLSSLLQAEKDYNKEHSVHWDGSDQMNNVLNGIAYHKETGTFWVTGKNWHHLYQL